MLLKKFKFSVNDQITFSNLSGDKNPIHLDPEVSYRLYTGRIVVRHKLFTKIA